MKKKLALLLLINLSILSACGKSSSAPQANSIPSVEKITPSSDAGVASTDAVIGAPGVNASTADTKVPAGTNNVPGTEGANGNTDSAFTENFLNGGSAKVADSYIALNSYDESTLSGTVNLEQLKKLAMENNLEAKEITDNQVVTAKLSVGASNYAVIQLNNIGISYPDDNSFMTFVFLDKAENSELVMSYMSWPRCEATLYDNGYYESSGSGGATTHYYDNGYLGEDGKFHRLLSEMEVADFTLSYISADIYNSVYTDGNSTSLMVTQSDFDNKIVYSYATYDGSELTELDKAFVNKCKDVGMNIVPYDEYQTLIKEYYSNANVSKFIDAKLNPVFQISF